MKIMRTKAWKLLERHAGFEPRGYHDMGFVPKLDNIDTTKAHLGLRRDIKEIFDSLQAVNRAVNWPNPGTIKKRRNWKALAEAARFMSWIISEGLRFHREWKKTRFVDAVKLDRFEKEVHRMAWAWNAVIDGGILDVRDDCTFEW